MATDSTPPAPRPAGQRLNRIAWLVPPEVAVRPLLGLTLVATLALLLAHALSYRFLCDDAYISFRYARNLSRGCGLVFNPGFERVEGYTNFLWTVLLAGIDRLGVAPDVSAPVVSIGLTVVLWWLVLRTGVRVSPHLSGWSLILPLLLLAATRSVAVWSTSGLETRLFEVLVLLGVFRLIVEVRAQDGEAPAVRPVAWLLLALATLTRPDGLIITASTLGTAALWLLARGRLRWRWALLSGAATGLVIGSHLLLRRMYYGDWVPNTYHVKIGGRTWWSMGGQYLECFALEYAAWTWLPLLAAGLAAHVRGRSGSVPAIYAAAVLPHALYVASIGGDHFEYRPLDLYFPLVFLLLGDGAGHLARRARGQVWAGLGSLLVLAGLWDLPHQSHRQFPGVYRPGFPGDAWHLPDTGDFLEPARDSLHRLPGLDRLAERHRRLLFRTTRQFVGIRQEEHRLFQARMVEQGRVVARWIREGKMAADTFIAVSSVGVLPYLADLRTLDRLGLTDAVVSRSTPLPGKRALGHDKLATVGYARALGVDLWALQPAYLFLDASSPLLLAALVDPEEDVEEVDCIQADDHRWIVGLAVQGRERLSSKFPAWPIQRAADPAIQEEVARPLLEDAIRSFQAGGRDDALLELVDELRQAGHLRAAYRLVHFAVGVRPLSHWLWYRQAALAESAGDIPAALAAVDRALALAREAGDAPNFVRELGERRERMLRTSVKGGGG